MLRIADLLGVGATSARAFTQHTLPPECPSADAFLRTHRRQIKEGASGWSSRGQTRCVSAEAWAAHVAEQTSKRSRRPKLAIVEAPVDELDRALGIRTRAAR
jgi:hypothetical protein